MPAYVIVDITIHDNDKYDEYKKLTPASISAYGGRFIVRGGKSEVLEGSWKPERLVILEFPDVETVKRWWDSSEYGLAKSIRQRVAHTEMLVVEGLPS